MFGIFAAERPEKMLIQKTEKLLSRLTENIQHGVNKTNPSVGIVEPKYTGFVTTFLHDISTSTDVEELNLNTRTSKLERE